MLEGTLWPWAVDMVENLTYTLDVLALVYLSKFEQRQLFKKGRRPWVRTSINWGTLVRGRDGARTVGGGRRGGGGGLGGGGRGSESSAEACTDGSCVLRRWGWGDESKARSEETDEELGEGLASIGGTAARIRAARPRAADIPTAFWCWNIWNSLTLWVKSAIWSLLRVFTWFSKRCRMAPPECCLIFAEA
jgi:hypothetical protein